jgi:hypothetical protein
MERLKVEIPGELEWMVWNLEHTKFPICLNMESTLGTTDTKLFLLILEEEFKQLRTKSYRRAFVFKLIHALIMFLITVAGLITSIKSSNMYNNVAPWLISGLGTFVVICRTVDSLFKFEHRGVSNAQVYLRACLVCDEIARKTQELKDYETKAQEEINYAIEPSPMPEIITPKYVALLVNHIFKEFDSLRLTPYTDHAYERIVNRTPQTFVGRIQTVIPKVEVTKN